MMHLGRPPRTDTNPEIVESIRQLGNHGKRFVGELEDILLSGRDTPQRTAAAEGLGIIGSRRARATLSIGLFNDEDPAVVRECANALARCGRFKLLRSSAFVVKSHDHQKIIMDVLNEHDPVGTLDSFRKLADSSWASHDSRIEALKVMRFLTHAQIYLRTEDVLFRAVQAAAGMNPTDWSSGEKVSTERACMAVSSLAVLGGQRAATFLMATLATRNLPVAEAASDGLVQIMQDKPDLRHLLKDAREKPQKPPVADRLARIEGVLELGGP